MMNATININDKRLTCRERHLLRQIALRLAGLGPDRYLPRPPLPPGYQQAIDRAFGGCGEDGDLEGRGS
jgi:hypothetical protein